MLESLHQLDRYLLFFINSSHSPLLDVIMWQVSATWHTVLLIIFIGYLFMKRFSRLSAVKFIVSCCIVLACTDLSSNSLKHMIKRYRPTHNAELKAKIRTLNNYVGGRYSFVSGHSANSFGLITFIFLCLRWIPVKYRSLLFLYPVLICYSRIYLGVHYPSDTFAGMVGGCLIGALGYMLLDRYFMKLHEPAA